MVKCPKCGVPDYADFRVEMHKAVIYRCSNCNHSWKKYRPRDKWIPSDQPSPVEIKYQSSNRRAKT